MEKKVLFRDFEERDIDFIYRCKNDEKLNSLIVGPYHPFTYEEAVNWVHGCMGEHDTFKFWAICTNDEEKRIVGWTALADINNVNKSACFYSVVIGDEEYRDGLAWIQAYLFVYEYVFEKLGLNRLFGSNLEEQLASYSMGIAMFETVEGIARQAVFKNGKYNNVVYASILRDEYFFHKEQGDFEYKKIIFRLLEARKELKRKIKR